VIAHILQMPIN